MGLLDSVIGSVTGQSSGGTTSTSPLVKGLLLLLAANAASKYLGKGAGTPQQPADAPSSGTIDSGLLKGLPSLDSLLDKLKGAGHGDTVQSWIGRGANNPIAPQQLESALGPDTVTTLTQQTNLPRDQLMSQLSGALPQVIDKLTPEGKLPAADQRGHW